MIALTKGASGVSGMFPLTELIAAGGAATAQDNSVLSTKKHSPTAGSAKKLRRKSTDSLMKQLDQLERKIALGRERSQYFK